MRIGQNLIEKNSKKFNISLSFSSTLKDITDLMRCDLNKNTFFTINHNKKISTMMMKSVKSQMNYNEVVKFMGVDEAFN
jgi:hypothetical protein